MDDNTAWSIFFKCTATVLITLIICVTGSCQYSKHTLSTMVHAGANPIEAACAMGFDGAPMDHECMTHEWLKAER